MRSRKPAGANLTYRLVVSLRAGEVLDGAQLREAERAFAGALGFGEHRRVAAAHGDTDNFHMHVACNRVHPVTGKAHSPWGDYRALERRFGLSADLGMSDYDGERAGPTAAARDFEARTWRQSFQGYCLEHRDEIVAVAGKARGWGALHAGLAGLDVALRRRGAGLAFVRAGGGAGAREAVKARATALGNWWEFPYVQFQTKRNKGTSTLGIRPHILPLFRIGGRGIPATFSSAIALENRRRRIAGRCAAFYIPPLSVPPYGQRTEADMDPDLAGFVGLGVLMTALVAWLRADMNGRMERLETAHAERFGRIEAVQVEQGERLTRIETGQAEQGERLTRLEAGQAEQGERLTRIEATQAEHSAILSAHGERLTRIETAQAEQTERLTRIEATQAEHGATLSGHGATLSAHGERLTRIETGQAEQGERLTRIEATLSGHSEALSEHGAMLSGHSEALSEHGAMLSRHSEALSQHGAALSAHGATLSAHGELLARIETAQNELRKHMEGMETGLLAARVELTHTNERMARIEGTVAGALGRPFPELMTRPPDIAAAE